MLRRARPQGFFRLCRLRTRPVVAASAIAWLSLAGVGCGGERAAESSEDVDQPSTATDKQGEPESAIRLDVATWVPALEGSNGWWGVASAGTLPDSLLTQSDVGATLSVSPGTYDLYWLQDYDHRNGMLLLAREVRADNNKLTTVGISTGIRLEPADWVPQLHRSTGWWGMVRTGEEPVSENLVNWSHSPGPIPVPPGEYDLYWVQDYDHRSKPLSIVRGVTAVEGELLELRQDTGVRLRVANWVPRLNRSTGWWGLVPVGATPDERVNWSRESREPLPVPSGIYDVWWKQDYDSEPEKIKEAVPVSLGELVEVIASPSRTQTSG